MVQEYTMYSYSRTDFGDAAAWGQKLPMRLHRLIFALGCFSHKNRASPTYDAMIFYLFSVAARY
jgi:hypothetical protein